MAQRYQSMGLVARMLLRKALALDGEPTSSARRLKMREGMLRLGPNPLFVAESLHRHAHLRAVMLG